MPNLIEQMKLNAAKAALDFIEEDQVVGIGTGSTINIFIQELVAIKHKIAGAVSSSIATTKLLQSLSIPVLSFNSISDLPIYIDGADAYNSLKQLVKGSGGALTQEKILASASKKFICIVDASKKASVLGSDMIPVEVIPMARSYVAHALVKLGGQPEYRNNFITDNGNIILDVYGLQINEPLELEHKIKQIPGVVENGIFAARAADILIIGNETYVTNL